MSKSVIAGLVAVIAVTVAVIAVTVGLIYALYPVQSPRHEEPGASPAPATTSEPKQSAVVESGSKSPEAPEAAPEFASPTFDVVRINREGNAVIAGRATPGARVTVRAGESVVGTVTADDRGEWVLVPEIPLDRGSQTLSLRARSEGGTVAESDDVVVVVVPEQETTVTGSAEGASTPQQVIAVAMPRDKIGASRILQGPVISANVLSGSTVQLSTVNYDERGRLVLSGFAPPGSAVRIKVDGRPIGTTVADDTGYWELTPRSRVTLGDHKLTVEQLDEGGSVAASVRLPFTRAEVMVADLQPGDLRVTVQPGNSLWRIARATYGEGVMYTVIYAANTDQITAPELIYPGQVFVLPPQN